MIKTRDERRWKRDEERIMRMLIVVLIWVSFMVRGVSFAQEMSEQEAQKQAFEIHQHASSDVIYLDEEERALYYQNIQIIQLLKEIRELLRQQVEKLETQE